MTTRRDDLRLADLVDFARLEVASGDVEPWAATLRAEYLSSSASIGPIASE
jgi:hypothetical protein